tara:strand:+ start:2921 stop:3820 length:900 start_codon:yes stop_codon:yes gene_type:complete
MVNVPENFSMNPEQLSQMQQNTNPLSQFMRQPAIYIQLPSGGKFYSPGSLEMPINNEIPVLPMSTKDEITVNTPDALMNGQGVVDMIHSCCPSIKNAWEIPLVDLDTILIAIRIASYGEKMEYTSTCPHCENKDEYELDLRQFIDLPVNMDVYLQPFEYKGMQVYLQPVNYETLNVQNLENFEQQRLMVMVNDSELGAEEKQRRFAEIFRNMTNYTVRNVAGSIRQIVTPDMQTVDNPDHINEFVRNSERQFYDTLKKFMEEVNKGVPEKTVTTNCDECKQEYTTPFTFDQANFFAFAS